MTTVVPVSAVDNNVLEEQVYDSLMASIEQDLLTANIPTLDTKYAMETADEHTARMERYKKAYAKFDKAMAGFLGDLSAQTRRSQQKSLREKEEKERAEEQEKLNSLTSAFA